MAQMKVKLKSVDIDREALSQMIQNQVINGLSRVVSPHFVKAAQNRAPVGTERNFNPTRGALKALELVSKEESAKTNFSTAERQRLGELRSLGKRDLANEVRASDIKFFRGVEDHAGATPDHIDIVRGQVRGAFQHKPGTLRDSIHLESIEAAGSAVVMTVIAEAPYAAAIHEGFTHKGGRHHDGAATQIPAQPFFEWALPSITEDIENPRTWSSEG